MKSDFYHTQEYRKKQSLIMKENWKAGVFNFRYKREKRVCVRKGCSNVFEVILSDPKVYCTSSCATIVNNKKRGSRSEEVKNKIALSLKGRPNPFKGVKKIPLQKVICANCRVVFLRERWEKKRFCNSKCAMEIIGGRPTSPKASRGKFGIRKDIDSSICFYSRWEANVVRLFNYLNIDWLYQPKTFDLGTQKYTPDFYLPEYDFYIEVKNFLWKYSKERDERFRKVYPDTILILLLKDYYLELQEEYSQLIPEWEYKNSPFPKTK